MKITCLHTSDVHVPTFDALIAERAPDAIVEHVVREDLLARARIEGIADIRDDAETAIRNITDADAVLCTCSTLGEIVDGLADRRLLRVDRPMMEAASRAGPKVLMAICLESTRDASRHLLISAAQATGYPVEVTSQVCADAWAYFGQGDQVGFAQAIAQSVRGAVEGHDCIVLAQASMRVAVPLLADLGIPVFASPDLAADAVVALAAE